MAKLIKKLPIGIDNFGKLRTDGFYYVDKTGLIIDLLEGWSEVTLFTRPRRFGKSLNMSMLEAFFSPDSDKGIFEGLKIAEREELCREHMGRYPVLSLSLKSVNAENFETAYELVCEIARDLAIKVDACVAGDIRLHAGDRFKLERLLKEEIPESALYGSLRVLSDILERHYGEKVIVLIDEYDVPLAKAYERGYYDRMALLVRNLFEQALKSNSSLKFAVLTGCMRISKESIFTGLNNLRVLGVADARSDEYFGFTDREIKDLLEHYNLGQKYSEVAEWYDGYRFGNINVYCPWDVVNYVDSARFSGNDFPENYWINSSGNDVVARFIRQSADATAKGEMEALVNGETVVKTIRQELTYQDMYSSSENLWSVLLATGYLTQRERIDGSRFKLAIPNREVRDVFASQILRLFEEEVKKDEKAHARLLDALGNGDASAAEKCLGDFLRKTISIRDTAVRRSLKENFYHGVLLALLSVKAGWSAKSNQEAGDGYGDIIVRSDDYGLALVLELKYADGADLDASCEAALRQIEEKNYAERLVDEGFERVLKYGIAFRMKKCRVMLSEHGGFYRSDPALLP